MAESALVRRVRAALPEGRNSRFSNPPHFTQAMVSFLKVTKGLR
jgi:hypothetical protein